jgi:GT2 family glycosyltransferase
MRVKPFEIIVVDDCSRSEVRQELQELSGLATIISTPGNLGLGGARNYGVSQAKGRLLAFLDDDDLFHPRRLEMGLRYMEAHGGCHAVGGGFTMVSGDRTEYWGEKVTRTASPS